MPTFFLFLFSLTVAVYTTVYLKNSYKKNEEIEWPLLIVLIADYV